MLFGPPSKPTTSKKIIYLIAATFLGLLLSLITHAFIELKYLRLAENQNLTVPFYGGCALIPLLQITLITIGIFGGFFLGYYWWRKLYIERAWRKKRANKK